MVEVLVEVVVLHLARVAVQVVDEVVVVAVVEYALRLVRLGFLVELD